MVQDWVHIKSIHECLHCGWWHCITSLQRILWAFCGTDASDRYELEKALLEGSLKVEDLPKVWNQKMEEYLGCTPETDAQGCLQDVVSTCIKIFASWLGLCTWHQLRSFICHLQILLGLCKFLKGQAVIFQGISSRFDFKVRYLRCSTVYIATSHIEGTRLWSDLTRIIYVCEKISQAARNWFLHIFIQHWSAGLLGYFPTYSLGAMYACQLFKVRNLPVCPVKLWMRHSLAIVILFLFLPVSVILWLYARLRVRTVTILEELYRIIFCSVVG